MKNKIIVLLAFCILTGHRTLAADFFQINLEQSNLYSPSTLIVNAGLTDKARLQGKWHIDVAVYIDRELIRKESLKIAPQKASVFKLDFPEVRKKINGRCRAELFLDGEFVEGVEKKISVWPRPVPYELPGKTLVIWAYDKSGGLQKLFKSTGIKAVDATFQTARDFSKPDLIFIGENTPPKYMEAINGHMMASDNKPMVVFLAQKEFEKTALLKICKPSTKKIITYDMQAGLLKGLTKSNILVLTAEAKPVCLNKDPQTQKHEIDSLISQGQPNKDKRFESYIGIIQERGYKTIYCQFPIMSDIKNNPVSRKLFFNLLEAAITQIREKAVEIDSALENKEPKLENHSSKAEKISEKKSAIKAQNEIKL